MLCVCACVRVHECVCNTLYIGHVAKETSLSQGFTSLFGEKTATNSMTSSNPFGSLGNVSDSKN